MPLGHQLIAQILPEDTRQTASKHVRGVYTSNRNYKIACRFYYYFTIKGLKYERSIGHLHEEFDLSPLRLEQLIMQERETLAGLRDDKADSKYLQKKIPYFNWY